METPTLWHVQWDDEQDKQLNAFPGGHGTTTDAAMDGWVAFLRHRLT